MVSGYEKPLDIRVNTCYNYIRNQEEAKGLKVSELTKKLKKIGCYLTAHGKEHDKWYSPVTGNTFRVPRHQSQEIPTGTANRIMKDSGLI